VKAEDFETFIGALTVVEIRLVHVCWRVIVTNASSIVIQVSTPQKSNFVISKYIKGIWKTIDKIKNYVLMSLSTRCRPDYEKNLSRQMQVS
jgi:hypothetical protein